MLITDKSIVSIVDQLSRTEVNLLLIAEGSEIDVISLIEACNKRDITIAGGLFPKVIFDEEALDAGIIHKIISATNKPHLIKDMSEDTDLPIINSNTRSGVVLVDGLSQEIPHFLERLYDKYWNQISYVGGGCGSLTLEQKPCIFTNDGFYQNAAIVLFSDLATQLGVKHGWEKVEGPFVANKTQGNKIIELNWRPAFEVYKEVIETNSDARFESSDFFDIAKGFPFGIYREGQEDIVRDPIMVEDDGTLICVGKVEANTSLNILRGDKQKLIDSASEAAVQSIGSNMKDMLVTDCISRILYLEDDFKEELNAIKNALPVDSSISTIEGILSIGEISSGINGYLEFYNKTIVVSTFH